MKLLSIFFVLQAVSIEGKLFKEEPEIASNSSKRVFALLVVDVQYCFINGSLALSNGPAQHNGADVIPSINKLIETVPFDVVAYSLDWHPADHISFIDNLQFRTQYLLDENQQYCKLFDKVTYNGPKHQTEQVLWPAHCIENTREAELHDDLIALPESDNVIYIRKGTDSDIDSYSAFADNKGLRRTALHNKLQAQNVTHVFVTGLALDYCVGLTAIDAALLNYKTYVIEDASRGVNLQTIADRVGQFEGHGIKLIQSDEVLGIMEYQNSIQELDGMCPRNGYFYYGK